MNDDSLERLACCPQLIDPQIAFLSCLLLRRPGVEAVPGARLARKIIRSATLAASATPGEAAWRPALIFMCVDGSSGIMNDKLCKLRSMACKAGVPVVHCMTRKHLGMAMGVGFPVSVVCVLGIPDDHQTKGLLRRVMMLAEDAYGKFQDMLLGRCLAATAMTALTAAAPAPYASLLA
jgi:hypothetical protein